MRAAAAAACVAACGGSAAADSECAGSFAAWKGARGRRYGSAEEDARRRAVFCANRARVDSHNAAGNASYTLALNRFADLTAGEFRERHLAPSARRPARTRRADWAAPRGGAPASVDWRRSGAVTAVKDQMQCGACWSFAATGAMEGAHQLAGNKLANLSEQQLIDCESTNLGCRGGLEPNCFRYVIDNKGIETEEAYPYTASKAANPVCLFKKAEVVATFSSYEEPGYGGDEGALLKAVGSVGPVAVSYDAGGDGDFQFYKSGVFKSTSCGTVTDHAMLAVGYGKEGDSDYWLVKNQWGTDWGMDGYLLTLRGSNQCGIAEYSSYPVV